MIQDTYQKAIKFAGEKHANQQVPGSSTNYLLHLSNVTMEVLMAHKYKQNFDLQFAIQVAILHDILEDTETSFEELEQCFGVGVAKGVLALTKRNEAAKKERMLDSLDRINKERIEVGIVKLADRITNLQKPPKHWKKEKIKAYHEQAGIILQHLTNKNPFLENRLQTKLIEYRKWY